jgi:hypothetical protein
MRGHPQPHTYTRRPKNSSTSIKASGTITLAQYWPTNISRKKSSESFKVTEECFLHDVIDGSDALKVRQHHDNFIVVPREISNLCKKFWHYLAFLHIIQKILILM